MPADSHPQQPRYAIQKARGKGWSTLEVGDALPQAEARFRLMVSVNPKAFFRLIQLDYNPESDTPGTEFNWKLLQLHDPRQAGHTPRVAGAGQAPSPRRDTAAAGHAVSGRRTGESRKTADGRKRRGAERVRLPWVTYGMVVMLGLAAGALAYLLRSAPPAP